MNHGEHTWLNYFQFQSFSIRKDNTITKDLIDEYKETLSENEKRERIDDLMKKIPNDVVVYKLKPDYHIFRLENKKIRSLFIYVLFPKIKEVFKLKKIQYLLH